MLGFTLIGILTAVAAAWLFLTDQPTLIEQPSLEVTASKESGSPISVRSATPSAEPLHSSAEPSSTAASENDQQNVPSGRTPSAAVIPAGTRVEPSSDQATLAKAPSRAARVDCPRLVAIMFKRGSARLISTDMDTRVAPLREWLTGHPEAKILVEGHADSIGTEQSNLILSYRRAKALVALLHRSGISRERLVVRAAGEYQPISGLPDSAAANRRVILQIEGSENCRASLTDSEPR